MRKVIDCQDGFAARDPYVIKHKERYYRCYTKDAESIWVDCSDSMDEWSAVESKNVYTPDADREYSKELWAPELHVIDGKCYIYVACDDGDNYNHRMYVLENNSDDPMEAYTMHGKISDKTDKWAIDGTIMNYKGENYFVWSGWEGDTNVCQDLYIAKMKNPYEIESERVLISRPEYDWEKLGSTGKINSPFINEGPFAFGYNGACYISYSAAGSWCKDYCISLLKLTRDNPLDPSAWEKLENPVFSSNDLVQGAGHCSIVSEDDLLHVFFHAWDKKETKINWQTVSVWHANMVFSDDKVVIE